MPNKKILIMIFSILAVLCSGSCTASSHISDTSDVSDASEVSQETNSSSDISHSSEEVSELPGIVGEIMEETESNMGNVENIKTYTNYIFDGEYENAWPGYGFGDPFVMRWNGKYYLYSSTHDWFSDIKVWVSDDLVNWTYGGNCASDSRLQGAYAPEVTYYNGAFYMYTSPAGNGHYVLKATDPLGPFTIVTENLGNSIDGHVFIDDNGKWYFYHAGEGNLYAKEMPSPLEIWRDGTTIGADVNGGWTEGPMVIKRNGIYYLTYCGNHVWSKGYRIEGAVSGSTPLNFYDIPGNILMLNADEPVYGIGHSSTVLGPDMDTYYIVYHSFNYVPHRRMNIDALCLNGKDFCALGPTTTPQQMPKKPEIYTDFSSRSDRFTYKNAEIISEALKITEGGQVLTANVIEGDKYTAEINFYTIESQGGMLFSYVDENNYACAVINTLKQKLTVNVYENGKVVFERTLSLPRSFDTNFDFNSLQALSLKKDGTQYTFFINGLSLTPIKLELPEGKFGIYSAKGSVSVGYVAISLDANGSSLTTYYKPIEGEITAITSVEQGEVVKKGGISYVVMKESFVRNYYVNVSETATYDVGITYFSDTDTTLELYKGGKLLGNITLPATNGENSSSVMRGIDIEKGFGIISFKVVKGKANILSYFFTVGTKITEQSFDLGAPSYIDGTWKTENGKLILDVNDNHDISHGKVFYGAETLGDYAVTADITFNGYNRNAGIIVRGTNPAIGGAGNDTMLGRYFFCGYYVAFERGNGIVIYKMNYERSPIRANFKMPLDKESYTIRIEVIGNNLKVYLDGAFLLEITDNDLPFFNGSVGFTGLNSVLTVDNLKIEPIV